MRQKPYILSIAAISGGGKTTITNHLYKRLPKSYVLSFDDYDFDGPNDICDWVERGADYQEWDLRPLINDVDSLTLNRSNDIDYLILDYPFAYLHSDLTEFIDFTVFIDTPFDIAMARRIIRDYKEEAIERVLNDLSVYLTRGRNAYLNMLKTVRSNSDLIIDGNLPKDVIVDQIYKEIRERSR